jgi:hypothetical protein
MALSSRTALVAATFIYVVFLIVLSTGTAVAVTSLSGVCGSQPCVSAQTSAVSVASVIYTVMNVLLTWEVIALRPASATAAGFYPTLIVGMVLAASFGGILALFVANFSTREISGAAGTVLLIVVCAAFVELHDTARGFVKRYATPLLTLLGIALIAGGIFTAGGAWWPSVIAEVPWLHTALLYAFGVFFGFAIAWDMNHLLGHEKRRPVDAAYIAVVLFLDIVKLFPSVLTLRRSATTASTAATGTRV